MATSRFPYGDAYIVSTPTIDRVGAMMINDQKQRDIANQRQAQALDEQFSKNVAGIRDADVPDLSQKWGEYKQIKQNLYKNGNKLNDADRIALQMEAQRKLGEVYGLTNKSKEAKADEEYYAKELVKNPNNYNDDAHNFLMERRRLPLSKFNTTVPNLVTGKPFQIDFGDIPNNTQYQLGTTDFTPAIAKAKGTVALRGTSEPVNTPDGLQRITTYYKAGNSPSEYINTLQGSVVGSQKQKHLPLEYNYSEAEANEIMEKYAALKNSPEFKGAYPNEPDIPQSMFLTPVGKTMALMAMENAILHPPIATTKTERNLGAANAVKNAEWDRRNLITDRQHKANILLNQGATRANLNINDVYQRLQDNQDNGDINTTDESGKPIKAARFNSLSNDAQVIIMQGLKQIDKYANGDNVYQIKEPDGSIGIYKTDADGVPRPSKATRLTTITRTGINIKAQPDVKAKRAVVAQENERKTSKVKSVTSPPGYSKADLKANGWSDEQINKAVKAGKIKIN